MKSLLFISVLSLLLTTSWVKFTPESGDYTLELNDKAKYQQRVIEGGYADIYTIVENITSQENEYYIISVSKLNEEEEFTLEKIASKVFKDNYLLTCGCEVVNEKEVQYQNFKAIEYDLRITKNDGFLVGKSVHIPKGRILYSVSFITSEKFLNRFKSEYQRTINSVQLLK